MDKLSSRVRILQSALEHFGRAGPDGASTRRIALDAGTPMSSITYHFGGKEQLYRAVAAHVAEQLAEQIRPVLFQVDTTLAAGPSPLGIRSLLHLLLNFLVDVMVRPDMTASARFIIREQTDPTEAFDGLYASMMRSMLDRLGSMLMILAEGRLTDRQARTRAFTLVGQVLVFRVARATILRGTGWHDIGPAEAAEIKAAVGDNLDAILDQLEAADRMSGLNPHRQYSSG